MICRLVKGATVLIGLIIMSWTARADVVVLVHGWYSNADTWLEHGVVQSLAGQNWQDAGVLVAAPSGQVVAASWPPAGGQHVFRADLIAEAPLEMQASQLLIMMQALAEHYAGEPVWLVGHSAGGVVARLALVSEGVPQVSGLITLASPNLGTPRAIEGIDLVESRPFFCPGPGIEFIKDLFGGTDYDYLKYSLPAVAGLTPAVPGSLIDWLNRQPHPDIAYHAVIRTRDDVVPAFSQDLNNVPELQGRSSVYLTPASHYLNPADGYLIASIINDKAVTTMGLNQ